MGLAQQSIRIRCQAAGASYSGLLQTQGAQRPPCGRLSSEWRARSLRASSTHPRPMTTYSIYDGTDLRGTVGKVAPGIYAQEGRSRLLISTPPEDRGWLTSPPSRQTEYI